MYQAWLYYGEFLVLGIWGTVLTLARRILFGRLCREAALGSSGKGKMLKAMTLKFEKSYEVNVGVYDMRVFVQKYLCQEKRLGIRLGKWRRLPERWTGLILGIGFVEAMVLKYLEYDSMFCLNRFLAAATAAVFVRVAVLWFETDSLWERAQVCLLDYVSNTLYPRQIHTYEGFGREEAAEDQLSERMEQKKQAEEEPEQPARAASERGKERQKTDGPVKAGKPEKGVTFDREEEQIFQEVLSDFLGSST